jgi:hypothetical protein
MVLANPIIVQYCGDYSKAKQQSNALGINLSNVTHLELFGTVCQQSKTLAMFLAEQRAWQCF